MKNRYTQDQAASAEILRILLQRISSHPAAFNPITFAVWYEFITGINLPLSNAINELLGDKLPLTDERIVDLHHRYILDANQEAEQIFKQNMQNLLNKLTQFTDVTDDEAGKFNADLIKHGATLSQVVDAEALQLLVSEIAQDTQVMRASLDQLQDKLHESKNEVEQLRQELLNARSEALKDPLTGIFNRRGFVEQMKLIAACPERQEKRVSFLMLDIDFFKKINDAHGHIFGDKVICMIADVLTALVKGQDSVARMGGEEFAVILPDTHQQDARVVAENIRKTIEKGRIRRQDKDEPVGAITVSVGIASCKVGEDWTVALNNADQALYVSKQSGRNRSTIFTPPPS